jgi:SAM-dependent methyltransferase
LDLAFTPEHAARLRGRSIECIAAPVEQAPLGGWRFDAIVMNQVVEHLWDSRRSLALLHDALNPGGRLILSTPNLDGWDRHFFRRSCWGGYYMPRHLNLFTPASLTRLLQECGFERVAVRRLTAPLIWVRSLQYSLRARRVPGAGVFCDANLAAIALFAALDQLALACGHETSNLQAVAWRS